ncbi:MAG: UDP-N-acetylmuramoyl-L-alanyl-D-glutamate--2,6-diaminopimelate ligase [Dokdonella sp.]
MSRSLSLRELLDGISDVGVCAAGSIRVRGLTLNSRQVQPGDAFVALRGLHRHGIEFARTAAERGATVILAEAPAPDIAQTAIPTLWIDDLRESLGVIASRWFEEPSRALTIVGVTGTNGKTSIVQLLAQALSRAGHATATIGTLGAGPVGKVVAGEHTTPDAIAVQGLLAQFRDGGTTHVAMEVSSHALDQGRVNAVGFDVAVFTNLTRDHLDYHGDMASYAAAKARLFAWPGLSAAVINIDDAFGRELMAILPPSVRCLRHAIDRDDADLSACDIESSARGLRFRLRTPWGEGIVGTALLGRFNVANLLAVASCLGHFGFSFAEIIAALAALEPVAGRMSRLGGDGDTPLLVVDYAHTPDALEQALTTLRAHCAGELVCVFGCGGDRDAGKRPQMGAIAERLADRIVITDDNPRSEVSADIVDQIVAGLVDPTRVTIEPDRAQAIALVVSSARAGDVVLIAGKGHESTQEINGTKYPFNDVVVARVALHARISEARPC